MKSLVAIVSFLITVCLSAQTPNDTVLLDDTPIGFIHTDNDFHWSVDTITLPVQATILVTEWRTVAVETLDAKLFLRCICELTWTQTTRYWAEFNQFVESSSTLPVIKEVVCPEQRKTYFPWEVKHIYYSN